jgi:hypothetical protein
MEPAVLGCTRLLAKVIVSLDEYNVFPRAREDLGNSEARNAASDNGVLIPGCPQPNTFVNAAAILSASERLVAEVMGGQMWRGHQASVTTSSVFS